MDVVAGYLGGIDFIIGSGDDFYGGDGIGDKQLQDPKWDTHWANYYCNQDNLKGLTWYSSFGNHDYNTTKKYNLRNN